LKDIEGVEFVQLCACKVVQRNAERRRNGGMTDKKIGGEGGSKDFAS